MSQRRLPHQSLPKTGDSSQSWEPGAHCTACRLPNRLQHVFSSASVALNLLQAAQPASGSRKLVSARHRLPRLHPDKILKFSFSYRLSSGKTVEPAAALLLFFMWRCYRGRKITAVNLKMLRVTVEAKRKKEFQICYRHI